ncbi:IS3 family transposase [Flexivirga caeni]|uniref:IS3 family transposase n=1 Tax=Flexivirga caeni TaxID=2294115 RepID=UPI001C656151|nr:IS3 family transposase [Flexivirga caeni]
MKFAFIADMVGENARKPRDERFPVYFMCDMLEVSRAGYYAWVSRGKSAREVEDDRLTRLITGIHEAHKGRYGIDRIRHELARHGERVGPQRVRRLVRAAGLECVHPRPYTTTTRQDRANQSGLVDLVGRRFVPDHKDEIWYGDITYISTRSGWVYLATVIDGFSRRMVGWAVADHMRESLVIDALRMAITARRPGTGAVVFHSDRGSVYTGRAFRQVCFANGIIPSVGHTGICYDNAAAESWNAIYKKELINLHIWNDEEHVKHASFDFIEVYYNRARIQQELSYLTPSEYETEFDSKGDRAA